MQTVIEKLREIDNVLTCREVATLFRVSDDTIRDLADSARIPFFRVGRQLRFDPQILANWLERRSLVGFQNGKKIYLGEL